MIYTPQIQERKLSLFDHKDHNDILSIQAICNTTFAFLQSELKNVLQETGVQRQNLIGDIKKIKHLENNMVCSYCILAPLDSYALYIYWRIIHSESLQNAANKPMKLLMIKTHALYKNYA